MRNTGLMLFAILLLIIVTPLCRVKASADYDKGRTLFIAAFFSDNEKMGYPKHQQGDRNRFLKAIETHLKGTDLSNKELYIIVNEIIYAVWFFSSCCMTGTSFRMEERICRDSRR
jgi:hypothetical protein